MTKKVKRFVVKPRSPRVMENGLATQKGNVGFDGKTQKILTDESLAREIDSEYGLSGKRDVYVYEDERLEWHDMNNKDTDGINRESGGHRYFFGSQKRVQWVWADVDGIVKEVPLSVAREYDLPIVKPRQKARVARRKAAEV